MVKLRDFQSRNVGSIPSRSTNCQTSVTGMHGGFVLLKLGFESLVWHHQRDTRIGSGSSKPNSEGSTPSVPAIATVGYSRSFLKTTLGVRLPAWQLKP